MIPNTKPSNPRFSCGPTSKRPGWTPDALKRAFVGRSHRDPDGVARLHEAAELSRELMQIPHDYALGIFTGSNTGAFEAGIWNFLGNRPVDLLVFDVFGSQWASDVRSLDIEHRVLGAPFGEFPDTDSIDWSRDVILTYNGTTSGVVAPNSDWIPDHRDGLVMADATSAILCTPLPWEKLDVTSWSWQKGLGAEAGHGMLALSPRALQRLSETPASRPIPRMLDLRNTKLRDGLFKGRTLNTPSMLVVEDALDAMRWLRDLGGLEASIARVNANAAALDELFNQHGSGLPIRYAATNPAVRSKSSVVFCASDDQQAPAIATAVPTLLAENKVAVDTLGHANATWPNFRIWCGPTIETSDVQALVPWISWAAREAVG